MKIWPFDLTYDQQTLASDTTAAAIAQVVAEGKVDYQLQDAPVEAAVQRALLEARAFLDQVQTR